MSTRVTREEWYGLVEVPSRMYKPYPMTNTGPCVFRCDVEPSHGLAAVLMQTPDHRAIALCGKCRLEVRRIQSRSLPPSSTEVNE